MQKRTTGWLIEVGEVKSSDLGLETMQVQQNRRLLASVRFLSSLFGCSGKLTSLVG